tara:strand:- start:13369 stop:14334 length:966 start_codon:yes stop_codon:yes gene_type:complete
MSESRQSLKGEVPNQVPQDVLLSVCMITYNHERYIRQALDSVLAQQTDFNFEICIGEDDSSDTTRKICLEYADRYPEEIRLILRRREDVMYIDGKPTGRRNTIETNGACRGKYIALLEGDDFWIDPYKLQKQFDYLEEHGDCSCVVGRVFRQNEVDSTRSQICPNLTEVGIRKNRHLISETFNVHTCTMCYRNGGVDFGQDVFQHAAAADMLIMLFLTESGNYFYCDPGVLSVYRITGMGAWSSRGKADGIFQKIRIWELYGAHLSGQPKVMVDQVIKRLHYEGDWGLIDSKPKKLGELIRGFFCNFKTTVWFIKKRLLRW